MKTQAMRIGVHWLGVLAAAALAAAPAGADYLITFESGGKLRVDSYRTERGWFLIPMNGGEIGVPEAEIGSVVPMEQVDGDAPLAQDTGASEAAAKPGPRVTPRQDVAAAGGGDADSANPLRSLIDQLRGARANPDAEQPAPAGAEMNRGDMIQQRIERLREMSERATDPAMRERFDRMIENLEGQAGGKSDAGAAAAPQANHPGGRRGANRPQ